MSDAARPPLPANFEACDFDETEILTDDRMFETGVAIYEALVNTPLHEEARVDLNAAVARALFVAARRYREEHPR